MNDKLWAPWRMDYIQSPKQEGCVFCIKSKLENEKENLEKLTNTKILGNRVHYLSNDKQLLKKLAELDFVYDSSNRKSKDEICSRKRC